MVPLVVAVAMDVITGALEAMLLDEEIELEPLVVVVELEKIEELKDELLLIVELGPALPAVTVDTLVTVEAGIVNVKVEAGKVTVEVEAGCVSVDVIVS